MRKKFIIWGVVAIILAAGTGFFYSWRPAEAEKIAWGAIFSQKQAEQMGLDGRRVYSALLDDLQVRKIKIAVHWDLLEQAPGSYDFSELDWQLARAGEKGAKVMLAIGMKTPRWPECHIPEWAESMDKKKQQAAILAMLEAIVSRYRENAAVESWQVENEPLFPFGECPWRDKEFLKKEVALVKELDMGKRPVVISDSGEGSWWFEVARAGDVAGITMYRRVYFSEMNVYVDYFLPPAFYSAKAGIVNKIFGKRVVCVELQAEPWTAHQKYDGGEGDGKTMDIEQFKKNIAFAKSTGLDEFYLWGSEWWYWMKENHRRPEFWEEAKALF
jgi:hypothetical protein